MKHSPGNKPSLGLSPALLLLETRSKHSGRWRRGKGKCVQHDCCSVLFRPTLGLSSLKSFVRTKRASAALCYLLFAIFRQTRFVSPSLLPRSTLSQDEPISPRNCILPPSLALKVRNDTTLLVRRARYRTKLGCFLVCHDYTNI